MPELNYKEFISKQKEEIKGKAGLEKVVSAVSGGVDSTVTNMLAKQALGDQLVTYFIDTGFMRQDEPKAVVKAFADMGIGLKVVLAEDRFLEAVKGKTDGEEKRGAFSNTFYKVFGDLIRKEGAVYLVQGTNRADIKETKEGVKFQHNVRDDYAEFGIKGVIEPVKTLVKDQIRRVGRQLGLPEDMYQRPPFPGPGLLARVLGDVTKERVAVVRQAQKIAEEELDYLKPSQVVACLSGDRVTGLIEGERGPGKYMMLVRAVKTEDFLKAEGMKIPEGPQDRIMERILKIPNVARVVFDPTPKPPGTVEYY